MIAVRDNAASYFVDRHVAEGRGGCIAFREADGARRQLSYGALARETGRAAAALSRAGVAREARAILLTLDEIETPILFWGALKAGVIPVPLNTLLSSSVYQAILTDARPACVFVSAALYPAAAPAIAACPDIGKIIVLGGEAPQGCVAWDDFIRGVEPAEPVAASPDEVAFWLYSSGSTGAPKGVKHVHGSLKATADAYGAQVLGIAPDDVVYSAAKLFFAYGLGNAMTFPMSVGATTVLLAGRPTPDAVSAVLAAERPTVFCGVPTLYAALLHHWAQDGAQDHGAKDGRAQGGARPDAPLRRCVSAGEALPADIGERWRDLWGVDILDGVGSTEMLHIFLTNAPGDVAYGTSGRPTPGYEVKLVDETDAEVGPDEIGELLVRGASAADGYWNRRDKTRATFQGEWTRTGDKYRRAADGRYVYCGRTDDMFKVSGIWLSPFEVEQALIAHPDVLEAAVVAERDGDGLEKPIAHVVPKNAAAGIDADALKDFVKARIGMWKYPRRIVVAAELPKTATGKIQRFKLREPA